MRKERGWTDTVVVRAYRVGEKPAGSYGEVFAFNAPRCGQALARASWVTELDSPHLEHVGHSVAIAQLVLAHFADGWQVWGQYH
jgi:hypothetical protein